jgi:gliding motility-associated-like protein
MINDALFFNLSNTQMQCTSLNIFNRWGKLVYSDSGYTNDWKGTNNSGNNLEEGTYFYVLDICREGVLKGYVNIVR